MRQLCRLSTRGSPCLRRRIATHTHSHHAAQLSVIRSAVDTSSATYKENAAQMKSLELELHDLHSRIAQGGPPKAREKHVGRGKMLAREYV